MDIPSHFKSITGDGGRRAATAQFLIDILMASRRFVNEKQEYKDMIVIGCERGVFNRAVAILKNDTNRIIAWWVPQFIATYVSVRQNLCQRLADIGSNPTLENTVIERRIPWDDLCAVPLHKILPNAFGGIAQTILERKDAEVEITYDKGNCPQCGSHKIKFLSDQTRGADESSTPSLWCYGCNLSTILDS